MHGSGSSDVKLQGSGGGTLPQENGSTASAGDFSELLKHMRRMHKRLEAIEAKQAEAAATQAKAAARRLAPLPHTLSPRRR